ncbi:ribokinase-like [Macrosteles quadrilineatus]|uniref:ribokinase-like n=1 Tax=Macrosteles quadrilineatus TaxID=74068 RepID=UPI0023E25BCD|nr:ribokinase-like [Macrosteles quadrilineatus]
MVRIAVVGSCMIDLTCFARRLPKYGETIHGTSFKQDWGGKGANQCVAATRLGAETALIACLGTDFFGSEYKIYLENSGVNTKHISQEPTQSGVAQISVADNGENQIIIVAGANNCLSKQKVEEASEYLTRANVVVFQFETPLETTLYALRICKEKNPKGLTIVNAAPAVETLNDELYRYTDILCVNETEAQIMSGLPTTTVLECEAALKKLLTFGCKTVIITLGEKGVIYSSPQSDNHIKHEKGKPVKNPVDTVGAGDVFVGSLAYLLAYRTDMSFERKISVSCQIAAISIMKKGTQSSFPYARDIPAALLLE